MSLPQSATARGISQCSEVAGYCASVGNASPELKEISDYIAETSYGIGFAEIIRHMGEREIFSPDSWTPFR